MTNAPTFFVIGFTRGQARSLRAEVVMRASSERHATALAADFAGDTGAAVALSQTQSASDAPTLKILANCGYVSPNPELWGLAGVPSNDWKLTERPAVTPIVRNEGTSRTFFRRSLFAAVNRRNPRASGRIPRIVPFTVTAVVAGLALTGLALKASGAQREARLVEMARPFCDHERVSNKELRNLVRFVTKISATKQEILTGVVTLCHNGFDRTAMDTERPEAEEAN